MNRTATLRAVEEHPEPPELRRVLDAFGETAGAIAAGADRDEVLHLIARQSCALIGVGRCSIYLRDPHSGAFEGRVAIGGAQIDAAIRRTRAGTEADSLTREILTTKRPILVRDTRSDVRPVRAAMRRWNVSRMLGVPMLHEGAVVGLLFLDNEDVPHDYTAQEQALCAEFANFAAGVLSQLDEKIDLRARTRAAQRRSETLLRAAAAEERLARLVGAGTDLGGLAAALVELSGMACSVRDSSFRQLAFALPTEIDDPAQLAECLRRLELPRQAVREAIEEAGSTRPASFIAPINGARLPHRLLVTPIGVGAETWGYLVMVELRGRLARLDVTLARRSATLIALQIGVQRRSQESDSHAEDSFYRDLLQGADQGGSVERRALSHGFPIDQPHAVCLFTPSDVGDRELVSPQRLREAMARTGGATRAAFTAVDEGTVALVEISEPSAAAIQVAREEMERVAVELAPEGITGAISTPCERPGDYEVAHRQVRRLSRSLLTLRESKQSRVEAATEIGAAGLFLAATDKRDAERFVLDTFGGLIEGSANEAGDSLLHTLDVFFDCSRSIRNSAAKLGVHENTVRYRLARIAEITGLDIAGNAADQLSAQAALLVLRLQGKLSAAPDREAEVSRSGGA